MHSLTVDLSDRSYPILVGDGLLQGDEINWGDYFIYQRVVIITSAPIAKRYLPALEDQLKRAGKEVKSIILPNGEKTKNWRTIQKIMDLLMQWQSTRSITLCSLGGGVIGDITGFCAAIFQRGVPFVQVPTTLLGQVDASVGGKTGINHPLGKNMIGAFWQPKAVLVDTQVLSTLPRREYLSGLAEVIKYGLIMDEAFIEWLADNRKKLLSKDADVVSKAILKSCTYKTKVIQADEQETKEKDGRALLNLGHTFGHAIETSCGYGVYRHGEAVAIGMAMAAKLSHQLGWLSQAESGRVACLLESYGLPTIPPQELSAARLLNLMLRDKKNTHDDQTTLRLVLLKKIGEATTHILASPQIHLDNLLLSTS